MDHVWDELGSSGSGNFARWTEAGDNVKGVITEIGIGSDTNDKPAPQLVVDTGVEVITVTASQAQLRAKLVEAKPAVGDTIAIVFTGTENREGGRTLKCFDVAIKKADGLPVATLAAVPAAVSAADLL